VTEPGLSATLATRLQAVERRLADACERTGRPRKDVTLVAVTKTVSAEVAEALHALGAQDLGENRPQELWRKAARIPAPVRWHLIGHLQRNKVERTLPHVTLIHSVDSQRLLEALEAEAKQQGRVVPVLLEVNASREPNKHGFRPEDVPVVVGNLAPLRHVRVRGLMTMAALGPDPETARPTFAALRALRDQLRPQLAPPHELAELSMGMSNDYEVAVEEGATLVRVGSALFEGIAEPPDG
jgi:PLP dependent protein